MRTSGYRMSANEKRIRNDYGNYDNNIGLDMGFLLDEIDLLREELKIYKRLYEKKVKLYNNLAEEKNEQANDN